MYGEKNILLFEEYMDNRITWMKDDRSFVVFYGRDDEGNYEIMRVEDESGNDVTDMKDTIITDKDGLMSMIHNKEDVIISDTVDDKMKGAGIPSPNTPGETAADGLRTDMDFK